MQAVHEKCVISIKTFFFPAVPSTASLIDEKDNEEEDMEETTSSGAMASTTSAYIESVPHLSSGVTSTAQEDLLSQCNTEDRPEEEDHIQGKFQTYQN
ncbi:hypothetical protein AOLI_G00158410 [Acnodon oligacanthus]